MKSKLFQKTLIIGLGLIGSSIARGIKKYNISSEIYGIDKSEKTILKCKELELLNEIKNNIEDFSFQFDLIIICTPLSAYKEIFVSLNNYINIETLITDVGSTKVSVIQDFNDIIMNSNSSYLKFIPSHPIAGLEKSGPEYGFAELFKNRFCILTPDKIENQFIEPIKLFWEAIGMKIEIMDSAYHDRILAMTSHIPQLIAYSIVATANELEDHIKQEVIKYSAAGFRDFTRLAGSDPVMWRDIYDKNKDAVLEMLGRFTEDLSTLQKAIRNKDLSSLEKTFQSTRDIRKIIEDLGQAGRFDPTESDK
tara:strand:- start:624 stop:1547 length:924 start_codon:yes stop_codon:yes gene_type:complete